MRHNDRLLKWVWQIEHTKSGPIAKIELTAIWSNYGESLCSITICGGDDEQNRLAKLVREEYILAFV